MVIERLSVKKEIRPSNKLIVLNRHEKIVAGSFINNSIFFKKATSVTTRGIYFTDVVYFVNIFDDYQNSLGVVCIRTTITKINNRAPMYFTRKFSDKFE